MASSATPSRLTGVTAAAALIRRMIAPATASTDLLNHAGRASSLPSDSRQAGSIRSIVSASSTGSPKLTRTLPNRWRSAGNDLNKPKTDSFSFALPDSSPR